MLQICSINYNNKNVKYDYINHAISRNAKNTNANVQEVLQKWRPNISPYVVHLLNCSISKLWVHPCRFNIIIAELSTKLASNAMFIVFSNHTTPCHFKEFISFYQANLSFNAYRKGAIHAAQTFQRYFRFGVPCKKEICTSGGCTCKNINKKKLSFQW